MTTMPDRTAQIGSPPLKPTSWRFWDTRQSPSQLPRINGWSLLTTTLAALVGGIILAELVAMLVVYYIRAWPYAYQVLVDVTIMTVIILPVLYFFSFKPLLLKTYQQDQSERILQTRLRLVEYADRHTLTELTEFCLNEIEALTGSDSSFFHFLDADQKRSKLRVYSTNTRQNLIKDMPPDHLSDLDPAGVWADALRHRRPIIHPGPGARVLPQEKGPGEFSLVRQMAIPILRSNMVVALLGLSSRSRDFTADDVKHLSTFADFAWDIIEHKQAEDALSQSEQKFRTFVDWTYDWEKWLDSNGDVVYTSPSCERMTGYKPEEFMADSSLLIRLVHPDDRQFYLKHHEIVHDESAGPAAVEYRIISRDGTERCIEHFCRPLWGPDGRYLGRRISNRDITQRKENEKKIVDQIQKEAVLTKAIETLRTDIARDLHDTLGQNISFLSMSLAHLSAADLNNLLDTHVPIQNMIEAANESYDLIRAMLDILQSADTADPLSLFTRYAAQIAERSSIQIDLNSRGYSDQLASHQIRQLFFIFREALSNIEKHAHATHVSAEFLGGPHALTLRIIDNGDGFDSEALQTHHYGLKFMGERAAKVNGSFSVESKPGSGTTITVVIPYENGPSALAA